MKSAGDIVNLQAEHGDAEGEHEGVQQRVHLAQDRDVVNQHVVPQVTQNERQDDHVQDEDRQLGQQLAGVARRQDTNHLLCP